MVPLDGLLHGVEEHACAAGWSRPDVGVLVEGDAGPVGQAPHGVDEVEVLDRPDEGDGVARLAWQPKQ